MQFEVKAYREPEGFTLMTLRGDSKDQVQEDAEHQGYRVIAIRRTGGWIGDGTLAMPLRLRPRFSVVLFAQELLALLDAGLSLVEALDILHRKSKDAESKRVIGGLRDALREGRPFSRALEGFDSLFPSLYIATIRSSERTGNLKEALQRYLAYHRQVTQVRDKIVGASIYPLLLIGVGSLVVLFLMTYVVPRFGRIYEEVGRDLPLMSRLLMAWGQAFSQHAESIGAGLMTCIGLLAYGLSRPPVRAAVVHRIWAIPALGEKLRLYELARFSRTLAMLLNGGIPMVSALEMVKGLLRQPSLASGLSLATQAIREGSATSSAFERYGLATEVGIRLLAVGERSGQMADVMDRIANFYDGEISRWLDWFSKLFEPILMAVIGLLIGGIVLLMYMPVFELANSIQ